jgi:putative intracellular protease/amidase
MSASRVTRSRATCLLALTLLGAAFAPMAIAAAPQPVLMVIANRDFYYREYADVRKSLEAQGLSVVVAAGTLRRAIPQNVGPGLPVQPDRLMADVSASDYSAIVFVGGWGASSYQYAFEGTYANAAYRPIKSIAMEVNRVIGEFAAADKPVAGICHGVSVLAWARVDGVSPLKERTVVAFAGGMPGFRLGGVDYPDAEVPLRSQLEMNATTMLTSASVGNPLSSADDVWVDGKIITAENYDSASRFAEVIAQSVASGRE